MHPLNAIRNSLWAGSLLFFNAFADQPTAPPEYAITLSPAIETLMTDTLTSGAVVVVRSPQGNWTQAFGKREKGGDIALQADDHFRVGSVTKTWTGTVILQLVDEGRFKLSDPISAYLTGVPNGDNITIEHLLSMRSGLFNYSTDQAFNQSLDDDPTQTFSIDALLQIAFKHNPYFAPGTDYRYSNTNTLLLGQLIEKITTISVAEAFQQRLFTPLGLSKTFFPPLDNTALPAPYARGYQFGTNVETIDTSVLSPAKQDAARAGSLQPNDTTDWTTSWGWTAGMGIASASELAEFAKKMVEGTYLSPSTQQQRLDSCTPTSTSPGAASYCLGLAKFGSYYGHTGEVPGYNTFMGHDPDTHTTIVVWTSQSAVPDGRAPAIEIAKMIIDRLHN